MGQYAYRDFSQSESSPFFVRPSSKRAASYAGLQKLDKLVVLYDSNDINLDGETKDSFTESVRDRYNAYGWHTALVEDGTDLGSYSCSYRNS